MTACPCFSGKSYEECCQPYHKGAITPPNALVLMRSRYAAYVLGLADYLMDTTHFTNPAYTKNRKKWKKDILSFTNSTQFVGLDIVNFVDGEIEAFVTFHAHLLQNGRDASFTEKSIFVKENGKWLYLFGC